jgi:hypothetical protein
MTRITLMRLAVGGTLLLALVAAATGNHPWP